MSDCPQFRIERHKLSDSVKDHRMNALCAALSERYLVGAMQALGSDNGTVLVFVLSTREVHLLEEHKAVRAVHCARDDVAYCCDEFAVTHNIASDLEVRAYGDGLKSALLYHTLAGTSKMFVANSSEVLLPRKNWLMTYDLQPIFAKKAGVVAMQICGDRLAVQCASEICLLSAETEQQCCQVQFSRVNAFAWISPTLLAACAGDTCKFFTAQSNQLAEVRSRKLDFSIVSIAGYNDECLIALDRSHKLWILRQGGDCVLLATDRWVKITTCPGMSRFFLASEGEIEEATPYSLADRVDWYCLQGRFAEAMAVVSGEQELKCKLCLRWLHYSRSTVSVEGWRRLCQMMLENKDLTPEQLLQAILEEPDLLPLVPELPSSLITEEVTARLLPALIALGDESLLVECIAQWPEVILKNEELMQPLVASKFTHAKIQLFLVWGLVKAVLDTLFHLRHSDLFAMLQTHPQHADAFYSSLSRAKLGAFISIDPESAVHALSRTDSLDPDSVVGEVPAEFLGPYLERRYSLGLRKSPRTDALLLEERLKGRGDVLELIHLSKLLDRQTALDLCRQYRHVKGQMQLLKTLGRKEELFSLLRDNFNEAIDYLRTHTDLKLWQDLRAAARTDEQLARLLSIAHIQLEGDLDSLPTQGRLLSGVKQLMRNIKQCREMHQRGLQAVQLTTGEHFLSAVQARRRGVYISEWKCAFCGEELGEWGLFRQCQHHLHPECELDTDCRTCERTKPLTAASLRQACEDDSDC